MYTSTVMMFVSFTFWTWLCDEYRLEEVASSPGSPLEKNIKMGGVPGNEAMDEVCINR